jgi:hypothetical protein
MRCRMRIESICLCVNWNVGTVYELVGYILPFPITAPTLFVSLSALRRLQCLVSNSINSISKLIFVISCVWRKQQTAEISRPKTITYMKNLFRKFLKRERYCVFEPFWVTFLQTRDKLDNRFETLFLSISACDVMLRWNTIRIESKKLLLVFYI